MSILFDERTPTLVYGFPGEDALFYSNVMLDYGTTVVGGVAAREPLERFLGRPVFATAGQCVRETGASAAIVFAEAQAVTDAVLDVADAGIRLMVVVTHGRKVPLRDKLTIRRSLGRSPEGDRPLLLGPDAAGILSAGKAMIGVMPPHIFARGPVGIVTRSASLGYEAAAQLTALGVGQSTFVGLGADQVCGASYGDILARFESDPDTHAVLLIGEGGGPAEAAAAEFARGMSKPVVSFLPEPPRPSGRAALADRIVAAFGEEDRDRSQRAAAEFTLPVPDSTRLGATVLDALTRYAAGHRPGRSGGGGGDGGGP